MEGDKSSLPMRVDLQDASENARLLVATFVSSLKSVAFLDFCL